MGAGHDHSHAPEAGVSESGDFRRRLWIAFAITLVVFVSQAVGAVVTGSLMARDAE